MKGVNEMLETLRRIGNKFPDRVGRAIYKEAQIEMTEAKRRTPVDTTEGAPHPGQLRASGGVMPPERRGRNISVTLYFGGGAVDYAIYVHEILDNFHPVGQAKYLESTLNESEPYILDRIGKRIHVDSGDEKL